MAANPDYSELLRLLNEAGVEYLIVGGYAVMKYSEPRYTKDLDIWVNASPANATRLYQALARFGAPLVADGVMPETFSREDVVYQIGVAPVRIDIMTMISGVRFADAWPNREESVVLGVPAHFISRGDLIANKRAAGREADAEHLERLSGDDIQGA